ncbi:MAG: hypothetical protein MUF48_18435 [Pirellulaceae bacterium]|nr:hypothetical protein [Pirellulaceae bacterium]
MSRQQDREPNREVAEERVVRTFLERAASVILESRTLDGSRFDAVVALADEVGLSRQQLSCELRFLQLRGVITSFPGDQLDAADVVPPVPPGAAPSSAVALPPGAEPPLPTVPEPQSKPEAPGTSSGGIAAPAASSPATTAPVPGPAPVPRPPAVPEAPADAYRRWVQQKLAGYPSVVLAEDDERGLIGVGTHRYRLADVLAGHIVRDVATAQDMRLARDLDGASCHSTVSESGSDDPRLQAFFEQVAPILARHRGMNAQSRVLINALAQQLELTDAELDRALTLLQQNAPGAEEPDPRQQERRESYRSYLRRAMAQLPDGIVTFQAQRRLVEAGEHFHGVAPQWIRPTINEVASEMGVRFVSREQAIQHVANLVQDVAASGSLIDAAARARVYAVGTRWGLDPIDVDAILRQHAELVRERIAADRRATRWILAAATAAFLGGFVLLVWLIVPRPLAMTPVVPVGSRAVTAPPVADPVTPESVAWWDEDIHIAVARARRAHGELRSLLEQARSAEAGERGEAYQQLAAWYVREGGPSPPKVLETLLGAWFAREPDAMAAERIPATLLAPSLALDQGLPPDAQGLTAAFRGVRGAARLASPPSLPDARRAQLAPLFEAALHVPPQQVLGATDIPREAVASLARRCYAALATLAAEQPERVRHLYRALAAEASASLDDATLHQLDAELLAVLLPEIDTRWADYQDVLRRTARSADPLVLLRLLDLFRQASDPMLRSFLKGFFAEYLGVAPDSLTDTELVDALRKSLGITAREQLMRRWTGVAEQAEPLLARAAGAGEDPAVVLQETVDLARLGALACALAQGDAGTALFEELEAAGPHRLDGLEAPAADSAAEPFVTPYPLPPPTVLRHYVDKLASSRAPSDRISLLRLMAAAAESVADLDPVAGQTLAEYLWRAKTQEEHQELLTHLPKFARWNALRLGVVDQLAVATPRESRQQAIASVVCGREVDLQDDTDRQAARRQLLASVLSDLPEAADADSATERALDAANRALGHFYHVQARLLQVPTAPDATDDDITAVLTTLVTHVAGKLDRATLTPAQQRLVAALPEQLTAAAFAAESDLHHAVLLQHIWLQVLSAHLARPLSAKALAVRAVVDETRAAAQAGPRVDVQLRVLEAGLLRLWLLYRPDPATPDSVAHLR